MALHSSPSWTISPVSLLELQMLSEIGRVEIRSDEFFETLAGAPRFALDEASFSAVLSASLDLSWTRDPFDRMLVAHSVARRLPLATVDTNILDHHGLVVRELRT